LPKHGRCNRKDDDFNFENGLFSPKPLH